VIELCDVTKRYGGAVAVDGLTARIRPGMVTGFLGPNGSGKSTTMRIILGLDAPTSGAVLVNGVRYGSFRRPLTEVGALLDANAVHGGRRAEDQLRCVAESNGIGRTRVREVLRLAGLEGVAGRRLGGFSLGMRQRLGIAAALLGDPGILMFDEPLNGLDADGVGWVRDLLTSLAAEGRTVLVSSHLLGEMAITADHLVVIGRGRLIADQSKASLVAGHASLEVAYRELTARFVDHQAAAASPSSSEVRP
jgi:ABC-2 type transport system ATP-binding protein